MSYSLGALIAIISLDVTTAMIGHGLVMQSWDVAGASATTPIVLTTTTPHGLAPGEKIHAVVAGVGGVTAANGTWELAFVDESRLSLGAYSPTGAPVASVGAGAYTSGGTISTALDQGRILLGRKYWSTNGAPPRVVFVPATAPAFDFVSYGGVVQPLESMPPTVVQMTAEQIAMTELPQFVTDHARFEVLCWNAATPADPDFADYDVTRALRDQVIVSCMKLMSQPMCRVIGGLWESQREGAPQAAWDTLGQAYKMLLEILVPVVDDPFAFVPFGTHATLTVQPANPGPGDPITIIT